MLHFGDITKIDGHTVPVVDVIIGGSPCQDLSVAGKRAGLAGERSGLFMEQIRVIKEMREADAKSGRTNEPVRPRYMVWENVPGAFSSNDGKDFSAVLEETIRVIEPEAPPIPVPQKGWPSAGCIMGDHWSVAWRVLDAQFWGVPQRRRRIALVADFGGHSAPEILFVRKSVSGNLEPGKPKGKEAAGDIGEGTVGAIYAIQGSMIGRADKNGPQGDGVNEDVSFTLNTTDRHGVVYGIGSYYSNAMKSDNPHSGIYVADTSKTLDALNCGYHGCNQGGMAVVQPLCIEMTSTKNTIVKDGVVPTLTARMGTGGNQVNAVLDKIVLDDQGGQQINVRTDGKIPTLRAETHGNLPCVIDQTTCLDVGFFNSYTEISPTLLARGYKDPHCVCRSKYTVRRLTPTECERLQGFPDGWTLIGDPVEKVIEDFDPETGEKEGEHIEHEFFYTNSKGKRVKCADSARYKALGNSIAIPPWKWVLKRLCACYERDATMASLFDGIGGFPYIWEQLNGKGSCLWASEIEEFPMAVTKVRFP